MQPTIQTMGVENALPVEPCTWSLSERGTSKDLFQWLLPLVLSLPSPSSLTGDPQKTRHMTPMSGSLFVPEPSVVMIRPSTNHFVNPSARTWTCSFEVDPRIIEFHRNLKHYKRTPLLDLPSISEALSVGRVLLKEESNRFRLPSFKILGASWATYRAIIEKFDLAESASLEDVAFAAKSHSVSLIAATDGNH